MVDFLNQRKCVVTVLCSFFFVVVCLFIWNIIWRT